MTADSAFQRAPGTPLLPATPLAFIWYFVRASRYSYLGMVLCEAAHATCGIFLPYAIGQIVHSVTSSRQPAAMAEEIARPFALFVALGIGEVLFARAGGTLQILLGPRQRQAVTRSLVAYLQHHSHRYLSSNFAGALAHRISETSMGVNQTLWAVIFDFFPIAIVLSVSVGMLFHAHTGLGVAVAAWAVAFVLCSYWLAMRCRPYALKAAAARSETTGKVVDSVSNLSTARSFARLGFERSYLNTYFERELRAIRKSNWYSERVRWFQFLSAAVLKVGMLSYSLKLWSTGRISVADFVVATSLSLLIITEARNLSRRFLEFFEFVGNVSNGVHTIIVPHELVDAPNAIERTFANGGIVFDHVQFGYSPERRIFRDLSVQIPPGQRVGLVGLSGSGKSTFVSLILRLYEVNSGSIRIDGTDVRELSQESLHSQVGLIPQDPSLFHRTLQENIRYGDPEAGDAEVQAAAIQAEAHDFILQTDHGYASMVGERGVKLSGGQRQRVAIARVLLKNAPILILDEATSSLDSLTERAIQNALDRAMRGKTVIIVAHRLSTIAHLDRILVFERGSIVEDGSHAALLSRGGVYAELWNRQAGGFLPEEASSNSLRDQASPAGEATPEPNAEVGEETHPALETVEPPSACPA